MPPASLSRMLEEQINALLPQTQCTKCGYDGCAPYATALARGEAAINRCPPGGDAGIADLARLLDTPVLPLDETHGRHTPLLVAVIDEQHCIGCTLCIQACPVDAIVGANKRMHTVLADWCTGCDLCLPPCPVDCISLVPASRPAWNRNDAEQARLRYQNRQTRKQHMADKAPAAVTAPPVAVRDAGHKQQSVLDALAKARARRAAAGSTP
ncbi:MAG: electron transport complex subunit RsxB [Corticimicrobacter sp.]|uniref:electron transport complex subunit RsxB n=1 Tax=Corticimicrobacter sp. TaxID=2678536 RepID=UPI0032DA1F2A